jgi:hypothetical protein
LQRFDDACHLHGLRTAEIFHRIETGAFGRP